MAIKIPIITELQDEGIKRAKREFDKFKGAVADAEGGIGKFKAGSKVALNAISANAATFAVAGATAFATFAAKGVSAFQDLALSADKFASATGLAVEEASRLMEVAGDIGIEAGTVETAIGKMNQNLGKSPDLFEELGVQVAYANDGTVDANETFLNVVDRLNKIKDPAEKARVATQLLGKGWRDMSTLINMGADELRKSLSQVSGAKTISQEEVDKAKKFRDTMDQLGDAVEDLGLMLGQVLVPILTEAAEILTSEGAKNFFGDISDGLGAVWRFGNDPIGHISDGLSDLASEAAKIPGDIWERNFGEEPQSQIENTTSLFDLLAKSTEKYQEQIRNRQAYADFQQAAEETQSKLEKLGEKTKALRIELQNVADKWDMLTGKLDQRVALDNAQQALADLEQAAANVFGTGSQEDLRNYNEQAAQFAGLLSNIAEGMGDISSRNILLTFETKGPKAALDLAKWLAGGAELSGLSNLDLLTQAGISTLPARAMGGTVSAGGTYLVGERGPELLTVGAGGGHVSPMAGGGNTINITVTSADPNQVVRALQQYVRQSGPVPVNTRAM